MSVFNGQAGQQYFLDLYFCIFCIFVFLYFCIFVFLYFCIFNAQAGEQYFLDLGGNIKKGPTSKSSSCYCGPAFQKFEKKLEKDKQVNGIFVFLEFLLIFILYFAQLFCSWVTPF